MGWMPKPKGKDWLNGHKNKTPIYAVYKRPTSTQGFHTSHTILHSHQQCITVLISLYSIFVILGVYLIKTILMGVKWYLNVILIFTFLITDGCWISSHVFIGYLCFFFREVSTQVLCLLFELFLCWVVGVLYVFWISISFQMYD